jgi:DNA/RNA-binding domain of Phe-tRNA-synthetase-like protein
MNDLTVASDVSELGITAVGLRFEGVSQADPDAAEAVLRAAEREVAADLSGAGIDTDPHLAEYRALHGRVGARSKDVAAPEMLRRTLQRRGRLPRISPLVDIYNSVSLSSCLAIGAHDADRIDGQVTLRRTTGSERFVPLGTDAPKPVRPGEYAYVDDADDVLCRLEVRQADKTKVETETSSCFVIVQGNASFPAGAVEQAAGELAKLLSRHCSAKLLA